MFSLFEEKKVQNCDLLEINLMEFVISDKVMRYLNQSSPQEENDVQSNTQPNLPFFSFKMIMAATGNFSHQNKLGQGGFGSVYKVNRYSTLKNCFEM